MSFYTDVAPNLVEALEEATGLTFQLGELRATELVSSNLGCIFKARDNPWAAGYDLEEQHFTVRVILRDIFATSPGPEVALDPAPLEDAADQIKAALKPLQTIEDLGFFTWYRTDYDNLGRVVDVQFVTKQSNEFNTGG